MKIKTRLFLSFSIIIFLLVVVSATSYLLSYANRKRVRSNEELFGHVLLLLSIQKDTLYIQESFTDVGATKRRDGYAVAEKHYKSAVAVFDKLIALSAKDNERDDNRILRAMKKDFASFYDTGKKMADAYLNSGFNEGFRLMEKFDATSSKILKELSDVINEHKAKMKDNLVNIHEGFAVMDIIALSVTLLAVIISLTLTFLISSSITRPIRQVTDTIKELKDKKGDLTRRIEVKSKDEIGELGQYFNQFLANFRDMVARLKRVSALNSEVRARLLNATGETASASNEIVSTIESLRSQMEKLNGEIEDVLKSVEVFSSFTDKLDREIDSMASATEESTSSIEEMIASVNNVSEIVNNKTRAADELVMLAENRGKISETLYDNIQALLKLVDEVSSIAEMIKAIANQTNLLSMNAAIEAAHAGDAGKGFAVVADEIRKLAETSNENANQITSIIERVVSGITQVSKEAGENSEAFRSINEGIRSISNAFSEINANTSELSIGGQQILEAMTQLREVSMSVKDGSVEMKDGISKISGSIQRMTGISGGILNGVNEIDIGAKDINNSMVEISELSKKMDENSQTMDQELNEMRTE